MNYTETLEFLFSQLPMYQNQGKLAYKKDLWNTEQLCKRLGHPEQKIKCIHIAGTNGKGSCSHLIASVLQEAGYKVGLYTSPHLKDFRERIKINGKEISEGEIVTFVEEKKDLFQDIQPSFFEWTVALSFHYFEQSKVDYAVIETGLGGRLDSTNVIQPILSVITNIGYDHMDLLGNSLDLIAKEKAGIIKFKTPVVIGNHSGQKSIFQLKAAENKSKIRFADEETQLALTAGLKGDYQRENIQTSYTAIDTLIQLGLSISSDQIAEGFEKVIQNTGLRGRWDCLSKKPLIIADTAHNEQGLGFVIKQIQREAKGDIHFVLGFVKDKNLDQIIPLFPKAAHYYFCAAKNPRSLDAERINSLFKQHGYQGSTHHSVEAALTQAKANAKAEDFIFVGGSNFVVAEIL